jgi:outer membrane autotransporter protein
MAVFGAHPRIPGWGHRWLVLALAAASAVFADNSTVRADCVATGPTDVSCTGTTANYDASALAGTTITVQPGALVIGTGGNDAIRSVTSLGNTLTNFGTIDNGITLVGAGNTFNNSGIVQFSDASNFSISDFTINGTFNQFSSGTLKMRFDPNGSFDQAFIIGTTSLAGKLIVVPQPGIYTVPFTYSFVTSFGRTGTFNSVTSASPFFIATPSYTATTADVTLTPIAFNSVPGLSANQKAVADVLTANYSGAVAGNAATFYSNLFAATSVSVFDQLSGAGTSATQGTAFVMNNAFLTTFGQGSFPARDGRLGGVPLGYAAAEERNHPALRIIKLKPQDEIARHWQTWGAVFGTERSVDGDAVGGTFGSKQSGAGGAAGVTYRPDADLALSAAVGASKSNFSVSDLATSGDLTAAHLGVHAAKRWGAFYAMAAIAYARIDNDTTRNIAGAGPTETASGGFISDLLTGRMEVGWRNLLGRYALTPFATVQYSELWQHGYSETSVTAGGTPGILGLSYAAQAVPSFPTSLGVQIDSRFDLASGLSITPYARLAWLHEFKPDSQVDASFISLPGASFTVSGARSASDAAKIDSGLRLALNNQAALTASFNSELASHSRTFAGTGKLHVTW